MITKFNAPHFFQLNPPPTRNRSIKIEKLKNWQRNPMLHPQCKNSVTRDELSIYQKKSTRRKIANKFAEVNCVCIKVDKHKTILDIHTRSLIIMLFILSLTTYKFFPSSFQPSRLRRHPTLNHLSTPTWQYAGLHFTFVQSAQYCSIHYVLEFPDYTI